MKLFIYITNDLGMYIDIYPVVAKSTYSLNKHIVTIITTIIIIIIIIIIMFLLQLNSSAKVLRFDNIHFGMIHEETSAGLLSRPQANKTIGNSWTPGSSIGEQQFL